MQMSRRTTVMSRGQKEEYILQRSETRGTRNTSSPSFPNKQLLLTCVSLSYYHLNPVLTPGPSPTLVDPDTLSLTVPLWFILPI